MRHLRMNSRNGLDNQSIPLRVDLERRTDGDLKNHLDFIKIIVVLLVVMVVVVAATL
jgi:hypothetical protein